MSEIHEIVKRQFDKQAENFSNWSVTKNIEYQKAYFDFCEISPQDTLLDLACGTGEYAIFAAPLVKNVHGVDISKGMIEIAQKQAKENGIKNTSFLCRPVESTPFENESFSIIICRSAFHHFHDYENIFKEMIRCCQKGGRISIQDIVTYSDAKVDDFFEEFEREVDISHHKSLSKEYIKNLYDRRNIKIRNTFEIEVELNVHEYLGHAQQSEVVGGRIIDLLEKGLREPDISKYFINKDGVLFFKRNVYLILGEKPVG
jgi:ubiquinone/menaquinone biosynthesis C-methylase UbiE